MKHVKRALRTTTIGLISVLALLAGPFVSATDQFWVSLGSYGDLTGAEGLRTRASSTFSELRIVPSETPAGFMYRVVEGPIAEWGAANQRLEQARVAGFIDAWLLTRDSSQPMGTLPVSDSSSALDSSAGETLSQTQPYDAPDYSQASDADATSSDDYEAVAIGTEELVDTAPESYGLHRLERSNQTLPPGEAVESRLRELRADPK